MNNIKQQVNSLLSTLSNLNTDEKAEAVVYLEQLMQNISELPQASRNASPGTKDKHILHPQEESRKLNITEHEQGKYTSTEMFPAYKYQKKEKLEMNESDTKYTCKICSLLCLNKKSYRFHVLQKHTIRMENKTYWCQSCSKSLTGKKLFFHHFKKLHCEMKREMIPHRRSQDILLSGDQKINKNFNTYVGQQDDRKTELSKSSDNEFHESTALVSEKLLTTPDSNHVSTNDTAIECELSDGKLGSKFCCGHCRKRFNTKSSLTNHLNTHFRGRDYACSLCKKRFLKYRYYKFHMTSHSHLKLANSDVDTTLSCIQKCEECDNVFPNENALSIHKFRVHKYANMRLRCPLCSFQTSLVSSLKRHVSLHTSNRQFICDECGSCFTSSSTLKDHKTGIHSNERNHSCDICGSSFKLKSSLTRHFKTHSDEKAYKCFCGHFYKLSTNLRKHQAIAHGMKSSKRKVEKVILEDDGYVINSPTMVKLQQKSANVNSPSSSREDASTIRVDDKGDDDIFNFNALDGGNNVSLPAMQEQQPIDERNDEVDKIDDLDIHSFSDLDSVDLSCAEDVLQDTYDFHQYAGAAATDVKPNNFTSMLAPIYLVETVLQQQNNIPSAAAVVEQPAQMRDNIPVSFSQHISSTQNSSCINLSANGESISSLLPVIPQYDSMVGNYIAHQNNPAIPEW